MQENKIVKNFLKNLEKYENNKNNKMEILNQLNVILKTDFNTKPNISVEYYKNLYPNFNPNIHKLLNRVAKQQRHDYRKNSQLTITKGNFIIEYN